MDLWSSNVKCQVLVCLLCNTLVNQFFVCCGKMWPGGVTPPPKKEFMSKETRQCRNHYPEEWIPVFYPQVTSASPVKVTLLYMKHVEEHLSWGQDGMDGAGCSASSYQSCPPCIIGECWSQTVQWPHSIRESLSLHRDVSHCDTTGVSSNLQSCISELSVTLRCWSRIFGVVLVRPQDQLWADERPGSILDW